MMSESKDGTARGLVEFLDYAADKGLLNKNTAAAQKSAVTKVLEIDGDHWEELDLRSLDLDQQVSRFQTLRKDKLSPPSLRTYESRFRTALNEYLRYLDDPGAYRPTSGSAKGGESTKGSKKRKRAEKTAETPSGSTTAPPARDNLITYPFPLRAGTMVYLQLPKDMSSREAERLARYVQSLALDTAAEEEPPF